MRRGSVRAERALAYARNTLVGRYSLGALHARLTHMYGHDLEAVWRRRGLSVLEDALEDMWPGALESLVAQYLEDHPGTADELRIESAYWQAEAKLAADLGLAPPLSSRVLDQHAVEWAELVTQAMLLSRASGGER